MATATLSYNLKTLIGDNFDPRRTRVWVTANVPLIVVDGTEMRPDDWPTQTPASDGTGSFTLVTTNSAVNPTSFAYVFHVDYTLKGNRERRQWHSSEFTFTTSANVAAISEAFDGLAIAPTWQSEFRAEMLGVRDDVVDISGIAVPDDVVEALVKGTAGAGPLTRAALSAKYVAPLAKSGTTAPAAPLPFVNVKDFGAVGNGTTDDTAAIAAAITAAEAIAPARLTFPPATGYRTTATVAFPGTIDVDMQGEIIYDGAAGATAITYNGTGALVADTRRVALRVRRAVQSDWSSEADRGILIRNLYRSQIQLPLVRGFTVGCEFQGDATGLVYNRVILGHFLNNKVHVDINAKGVGWANENGFYMGAFQTHAATNPTVSRYAVRIRSESGYMNNGNVFHKPSFEIGQGLSGGAEAVPILIQNGNYNRFTGIRDESNSATLVRTSGDSQNNIVDVEFGTLNGSGREDLGNYQTTIVTRAVNRHLESALRPVFMATDLHKRACPYDATQVNIPGVIVNGGSNATFLRQASSITIANDYVELAAGRNIGVLVDSRVVKRFVVGHDAETGFGGRFVIRCYDSSGALLDPAAYAANPLVKGVSSRGWAATTSFGGAYRTGSDSTEPAYFSVASNVATVWVGVGAGSAACRLSAFRVSTPELDVPAAWANVENMEDPIATQAPTTGTHAVGRRVWNAAPATGSPMGWVCTVAGTPGTWRPMANIA